MLSRSRLRGRRAQRATEGHDEELSETTRIFFEEEDRRITDHLYGGDSPDTGFSRRPYWGWEAWPFSTPSTTRRSRPTT
jgi:hypothetical protein